jgi:hypothetical protein
MFFNETNPGKVRLPYDMSSSMKTRRTSVVISLVFGLGVAACQGNLHTGLEGPSDAGQGGSTGGLGTGATAGTASTTGGASSSGGTSSSAGTNSIPNLTAGPLWARTVLSPATDSLFSSTAVDSLGNVYVAGQLWGPDAVDLGNSVTVAGASNGYDPLLVKYDSSGTAQWGKAVAAGSHTSQFYSVAVDFSGHVYVAGYLSGASGPVGFGNDVTVTKSDRFNNAVLAKYDSSGIAQWAQTVTAGSSDSSFSSVAVDSSGNVYVAGEIDGTGTYDFGNNVKATGTATSAGLLNPAGNAVLAKYNSSGIVQWAQTVAAGSPDSSFASVTVDSAGNVYAAGSVAGTETYDFGNSVTVRGTASGGHVANEVVANAVLVRYDSSGIAQWAQTVSASLRASDFSSVAADSAGNVYAAGSIGGPETVYFGNGVTATGTLNSGALAGIAGPQYVVLVKYNPSGIAQWARTVVNSGPDSYFDSVAVDFADNVYAAGSVFGYAAGIYDFGNATVTASNQSGYSVVLVKYDSGGLAQWARTSVTGGSSAAIFTGVTVDLMDNVYAAGGISGTGVVDFGNNVTATATNADGWNALLVKYQ